MFQGYLFPPKPSHKLAVVELWIWSSFCELLVQLPQEGNLILDSGLVDRGCKLGLQETLPKNAAGDNSAQCWGQHKG